MKIKNAISTLFARKQAEKLTARGEYVQLLHKSEWNDQEAARAAELIEHLRIDEKMAHADERMVIQKQQSLAIVAEKEARIADDKIKAEALEAIQQEWSKVNEAWKAKLIRANQEATAAMDAVRAVSEHESRLITLRESNPTLFENDVPGNSNWERAYEKRKQQKPQQDQPAGGITEAKVGGEVTHATASLLNS